jgi:FkbM family methyltransferase
MFKKLINRLYNPQGFELRRIQPTAFDAQQRLFRDAAPRIIFDVGAHTGETIREYKAIFPGAEIHSFEPFPNSFKELRAAAARHTNVHAVNLALSDRAGEAEFNSNVRCATNSLLPVDAAAERAWSRLVVAKDKIRVQTDTLDAYCERQAIGAIDILKIDVQGAEPLVLQGADRMLRRRSVRLLYVEILAAPCYTGQAELHEFLAQVHGYGFVPYSFYDLCTTVEGELKQFDAIFVRAEVARAGGLAIAG